MTNKPIISKEGLKMTEGLYIVSGTKHPDINMQNDVFEIISNNSKIHFEQKDISEIETINLIDYKIIVLFFHIKEPNTKAIDCLERYVENGGNLLGIHGVAASFKGNDTWFKLIGGRFIEHPQVTSIRIMPTEEGKCSLDVKDCYELQDEQYHFELKTNLKILMNSYFEDECHPSVWENIYGDGKVLYCALGHHREAIESNAFRDVIIQLVTMF